MIPAFAAVERAVSAGLIPGAAAGIIRPGRPPSLAVFGAAQVEPDAVPLQPELYFDLASLTKVLFTVREILLLVEEGHLDLDSRVHRWLPEVHSLQEGGLAALTVRQLLTHQARLPASAPVHTWAGSVQERAARLLSEPWPLGDPVYSDIGYILLGVLIERLRGAPLRSRPLGEGLTFTPPAEQSVATERCAVRGRLLRGEVHDETAFVLGGLAGHAGLFGTVGGVLEVLQAVLERRWLSPAALDEMMQPGSATRALGWERKYEGWSGGSLASPRAIGHTGFTGTGCWLDPERGVGWVLLTNSVHPVRGDATPIIHLRRCFGNLVASGAR